MDVWLFALLTLFAAVQTASAACTDPVYTPYPGQHVDQSTFQSGISTLANCQNACTLDPTCNGLDFTTTSQCWHAINLRNPRTPDSTSTHYNYDQQCTTTTNTCTFTYVGTFRAAGTSSTVNNVVECADRCVDDSQCLAYAFAGTGCTLVTDSSNLQAATVDANYVLWTRENCTTPNCPIFVPYMDMNGPSGIPQMGIQDLAACQAECRGNMNCYGVDYGLTGCYVHQDRNILGKLSMLVGNTFYYYDRECRATTASATTTVAPCPVYTPNANMHAPGGMRQATATTLEACRALCTGNTACTGFGYGGTGCWTHRTANLASIMADFQGNTLYVADRTCEGTTTSGPACPTYMQYQNRNGLNGIRLPTATSEADCRSACTAYQACTGFDWGSGGCWLNNRTDVVQNLGNLNGNAFYAINRDCPGECPRYTEYQNKNGPSGMLNNAADSAACRTACTADTSCTGYDFGPAGCYLNTNADIVNNLGDLTGTNFYAIDRLCTTGTGTTGTPTGTGTTSSTAAPCPTYMRYQDRNGQNGIRQTSATSEGDCRSACTAYQACTGFDWGPGGCWLNNRTDVVQNLGNLNGNAFYAINRNCPGECPRYTEYQNKNGPGGTRDNAADTAACRAACTAATSCTGYDFGSGGCYLNTNADIVNNLGDLSGTNFYAIDRECAGECPRYTEYQNKNGPSGTRNNAADTAACRAACTAATTCTGYDFGPGGCYLNTNADIVNNLGDLTGTNFYAIDRLCTGTVPFSMSTTWVLTNTGELRQIACGIISGSTPISF